MLSLSAVQHHPMTEVAPIGHTMRVATPRSAAHDPGSTTRVHVATFSDCDAAYAAAERLRRAGFTNEQVQFAMRGERPPCGIGVLGESSDRIVASNVGSF